jgi:hypothetical protein
MLKCIRVCWRFDFIYSLGALNPQVCTIRQKKKENEVRELSQQRERKIYTRKGRI